MRKFLTCRTVQDLHRRKQSKKLSNEMLHFINAKLYENDELTSRQLLSTLKELYPLLRVSLPTITHARKKLGWVCTKPHYRQLIHNLNKRKHLVWCQFLQRTNEKYENVIFIDEYTVQLERHSRLCFRKKHQCRRLKPRPKHPLKLYIWGGISFRGAINVIMFSGIMDAVHYKQILEAGLLPFINECFPDNHCLQQENNPKHCSGLIDDFFAENGISW